MRRGWQKRRDGMRARRKDRANRQKARLKVARVHARIHDRRHDYQHTLSTRIVHENQVICVERLAVKNMVKNHCLAKAISDVGWSEFVRQLEDKSKWYGRMLVKIEQWYPLLKPARTASMCLTP
jgi:putative transposase